MNLCKNCGWCCRNMNIEIKKGEYLKLLILRIPESLFEEKKDFKGVYNFKTKPCPLLKNNKCSIYEHRPNSCQSFPLTIEDGKLGINKLITCPYSLELIKKKVYIYLNNLFHFEAE